MDVTLPVGIVFKVSLPLSKISGLIYFRFEVVTLPVGIVFKVGIPSSKLSGLIYFRFDLHPVLVNFCIFSANFALY